MGFNVTTAPVIVYELVLINGASPEYTIYGIRPGMTEEEAVNAAKANGVTLYKQEGGTESYSLYYSRGDSPVIVEFKNGVAEYISLGGK